MEPNRWILMANDAKRTPKGRRNDAKMTSSDFFTSRPGSNFLAPVQEGFLQSLLHAPQQAKPT
jgi:hypothetical protein